MKPFNAACILASTLAWTAVCAEAGSDAEQVARLAAELVSDDFEKRETATQALIKMGRQAWPELEKHLHNNDPECTLRLTNVARALGILTKEDEKLAARLLDEMLSPDPLVRQRRCNQLLQLGDGSLDMLRKVLAADGARPRLKLTLAGPVISSGEKFNGSLDMENQSEEPCWYQQNTLQFGNVQFDSESFGERRYRSSKVYRGGGSRPMSSDPEYNIIQEWSPCRKTETVELELARAAGWPGRMNVEVSVTLPVKKVEMKIPGAGRKVEFVMNEMLAERTLKTSQVIFVLPRPDDSGSCSSLTMDLTHGIDGRTLRISASLKTDGTKTHRIERNMLKFAWYAILEKGVPVKWGSWASAMELKKDESQFAARDLTPREGFTFELAMPLPENCKIGDLSALAGYEVPSHVPESKDGPVFDLVQGSDCVPVQGTTLYARIEKLGDVSPPGK